MSQARLFHDLTLFAAVAQRGSFSRAAAALGMPVSSLSRRIRMLEETLGLKLIERTTRRLRLTRDGEVWLPQIARLAADAEATIARIAAGRTRDDSLTIALPNEPWAVESLGRVLAGMTQRPNTILQADPPGRADRSVPSDIALTCGSVEPGCDGHWQGTVDRLPVASPEYLAAHGMPRHPSDLSVHRTILAGREASETWTFLGARADLSQIVTGSIVAGSASLALRLAVSGNGIAVADAVAIGPDLRTGRLVRVLPDWRMPARPVAIMLGARFLTLQGRSMVEAITQRLRATLMPEAVPGPP